MKNFISTTLLIFIFIVSGFSQKAALISITCNEDLDQGQGGAWAELLGDPAYNLSDVLNEYEKLINEKILPEFPFEFISKEEVTEAEGYESLAEIATLGSYPNTLAPEGYVPIYVSWLVNDTKAINKSFDHLPDDVDAVLVASLYFEMYKDVGAMGIGLYKAKAYAHMKMYDREGNKIFKIHETSSSKKGTSGALGKIMNPEKIMPLLVQASEDLFRDMEKSLPKKIKKLSKKMDK